MIGYIDCFSGISGDMLLAALLGAGLDEAVLHESIAALGLDGECTMHVEHSNVCGLEATRVRVEAKAQREHHHLSDIVALLQRSSFAPEVRARAVAVFTRLAEAEAKIHGSTVEQVHFHEVGAVDALVDVVGVLAGFHVLGIGRLICSPLPMARGWVHCEHGELPLPAPAVCELLAGVPVYGETVEQELVTPTGAALVRELATSFGQMPPMVMEKIAYGAGSRSRSDGRPNLLRIIFGREHRVEETQQVEVIETHLDDWQQETWPHVAQRLMAAGALDVSLIPLLMKKGRPGHQLRVISDPSKALLLKELIFSLTSCIGLRSRLEERCTLAREAVAVKTPWGNVQAKRIHGPDGERLTPEYEDCVRLAEGSGISILRIYEAVAAANLEKGK
jgi:uncharacterized protein (TIGR00299 family) protein